MGVGDISNIVSIITGVIAIVVAAISLPKWIKAHKKSVDYFLEYSKHHFFYPQLLTNKILRKNLLKPLPNSRFIDYGNALNKGFYSYDVTELKVLNGLRKKIIKIPYKVEINYIDNPNTRINIKEKQLVESYTLSEEYMRETEPILQEFLKAKKNTTNDGALRLKSLVKKTDLEYECELQLATYFDQIRTNLTLDMPLNIGRTMRIEDLSANKQLKKFADSILANTIGVSAIWVMPYKGKDKNNRFKVFLKPRKESTGVFYNMLGTISGVVEAPGMCVMKCDTLEEYVTSQIRKEFYQESGYDQYMEDHVRDESEVEIIPLVMVRELMRGGKPQFFYLIKTPEVSEWVISKYFKNSFNGAEEFENSIITRFKDYDLSPETQVNILYAYSYIQRRQNIDFIDISDR